jgi:hypothetical protein
MSTVTPLRAVITDGTCTMWTAPPYGVRTRASIRPQASLTGSRTTSMDQDTLNDMPGCGLGLGSLVHTDTMATSSGPTPLVFHEESSLLRAVYYMLVRLERLQAAGKIVDPSVDLNLWVVDGELTLIDERLVDPADLANPADPNFVSVAQGNFTLARRILVALPDLLQKGSGKKVKVDKTVLQAARYLGSFAASASNLEDLLQDVQGYLDGLGARLEWPYLAQGTSGCVVGDKDPDLAHKLMFSYVNDEHVRMEAAMSALIQTLDPGGEWSLVPTIGEPVASVMDLPVSTVSNCGPHELSAGNITVVDMRRGLGTLHALEATSVLTDAFVHAVSPLFVGLKVMQDNGMAHLDIKPDNVVFHGGVFKYIDFGLTTNSVDGLLRVQSLLVQPANHFPPEFMCWLAFQNGITMNDLELGTYDILNKWWDTLPEFYKSLYGFHALQPAGLKVVRAGLVLVAQQFYAQQHMSIQDFLAAVSSWQLGMALAVAIHDALERHGSMDHLPPNVQRKITNLRVLAHEMCKLDARTRFTPEVALQQYLTFRDT